jgi:3-phenylpropionate/trans-cinnamate dioxygenase ferredoxin reductase component
VFHLNDAGQLQAVEAVNAAPEFLAGRLLIASRKPVDPEALADPGKSMKEIAA